MAKILIEVCMISAHGLSRSSPLWKLQWFAVGWIDPGSKYCTRIDASGGSRPTWKTKFSACSDEADLRPQGLSLTVEVYSRDPVFLREKLLGSATVPLKEFLLKFASGGRRGVLEEVGSFQLRRKGSGRAQGFVDLSIAISEKREVKGSQSANHNGSQTSGLKSTGISLAIEDGPILAYPDRPPQPPYSPPGIASSPSYTNPHLPRNPYPQPTSPASPKTYTQTKHQPYQQSLQDPNSYSQIRPSPGDGRRPTPPPPPPPSNTGFIPALFPGTGNSSYVGMPTSSRVGNGAGTRPGFGAGVGAGALAAGAVIFGDDFLSDMNYPAGFRSGSLSISTDPPF